MNAIKSIMIVALFAAAGAVNAQSAPDAVADVTEKATAAASAATTAMSEKIAEFNSIENRADRAAWCAKNIANLRYNEGAAMAEKAMNQGNTWLGFTNPQIGALKNAFYIAKEYSNAGAATALQVACKAVM